MNELRDHARRLDLVGNPVSVPDRLDCHGEIHARSSPRTRAVPACSARPAAHVRRSLSCPQPAPTCTVCAHRPRYPASCASFRRQEPFSIGSLLHCRKRRRAFITSGQVPALFQSATPSQVVAPLAVSRRRHRLDGSILLAARTSPRIVFSVATEIIHADLAGRENLWGRLKKIASSSGRAPPTGGQSKPEQDNQPAPAHTDLRS
jgi:hypothetical protein